MSEEAIRLRFAEEKDVGIILELIRGIAEHVGMPDRVVATEDGLRKTIFRDKRAEVVIAEYEGVPAGYGLFCYNYSTFLAKPGIWLEDLFVKPELRTKGIGSAIFKFVAQLAVERDCARFEWGCLDWNKTAIHFYEARGATPISDWTKYRLTGKPLEDLAAGKKP
jgi:GNAT superfamily N-acetyltransferase